MTTTEKVLRMLVTIERECHAIRDELEGVPPDSRGRDRKAGDALGSPAVQGVAGGV